ncbi:hypothetical protein NGB36_02800 [Streptomyces sp. RB6PN25]|uniref:Integral membrane protein n=1 Tax=Streptomyces humicola TaxID=2953240 RepID=A0ABT1PPF4_9ACTN|nr:hypothetical protein [Streptomyces humicola]MCQ4079556.1 hypothetical protein [Streptomyces humicola]
MRPFLSRIDRPAVPGLLAFLGWLGYVAARLQFWARGDIRRFVMAGQLYTHPAQLPHGFPLTQAAGYDGQFFYRLALDPLDLHQTAFGITMDQPYRFTRIGYPALTWVVSLGQHVAVPYALVGVNLAAVAAIAALGGVFARRSGRHALWGLLFAAYFGLAVSVGRDTAEPVADACLLGGMLAYRDRRPFLATALLCCAALTRETALAVPAAIAVVRLIGMVRRRIRPGRQDLVWIAPAAAFVAWQLVISQRTGALPLFSDGSRNTGLPFGALVHTIGYDVGHLTFGHLGLADISLLEAATIGVFVIAALLSLRATTVPVHERLAFVLYAIEAGIASNEIWSTSFGELRPFLDVYLLSLIVLLGTPRLRRRLGALAACALPALAVVVRRRILYM